MSIVHITWFATFAVVMVSGCKSSTRATPIPAPTVQSLATREAAASPAQTAQTDDAKVAPKARTAEPPPAPEGLVYVPGGTVHIGNLEGSVAKTVQVSPFFIDRTEVTVEAYLKCVEARDCKRPYPGPGCNGTAKRPRLKHPMNCIGKEEAERYCTKQASGCQARRNGRRLREVRTVASFLGATTRQESSCAGERAPRRPMMGHVRLGRSPKGCVRRTRHGRECRGMDVDGEP